MPLKVLIGGVAYGQGNVGDEAILEGILQDLAEIREFAEFTVLTWRPQSTAARLGTRALCVTPLSPLKAALSADMVICGGASIFAPYWPHHEPLGVLKGYPMYPSIFTLWSRLLRKPTMIYAAGVEPLGLSWMQRSVTLACRAASAVTVRDHASKALLKSWGTPSANVEVAADPAFSLDPVRDPELIEAFLRRQGITASERPLVALSMAYEPDAIKDVDQLGAFFAGLADFVVDDLGATPVFVPMNTTPQFDHWAMTKAIRTMRNAESAYLLEGDYTPTELLAFLNRVDMVISTRMHLLILAMVAGVPFLAVSRGPKIDSLANRIGVDVFARVERLDLKRHAQDLRNAWSRRAELQEIQQRGLAALRSAGSVNRNLALELIHHVQRAS